MRSTRLAVATAMVVLAAVLAGCSSDEQSTAPDVSAAPDSSEAPVQSEPDAGADQDDGDDAGQGQGEPLASVTVPVSYVDGADVLAEVLEFSGADELVRMRMRFTASLPSGTEEVALGAVLDRNESAPGAAVKPELVDTTHLKAYEPVLGGPIGRVNLTDGVPVEIVYYYATPDDQVDTFDVTLGGQAPSLPDVPFRP